MSWDGNVESYVDFRRQMQDMLIYDSESLRLSTLKAQINGKEKSFISDLLYNVDSIEEAFSVLDTHYGDIRIVLPRLRAKLDKLPSHPIKETDENRNIQQILNYWKTARNHGIEERAVDVFFIQEYSEKLSKENKKLRINLEIEDCTRFIDKIKVF